MVIWIIGLSGSGKTTILDKVYNEISLKAKHIVKIDGDIIREVFNNDLVIQLNIEKEMQKEFLNYANF